MKEEQTVDTRFATLVGALHPAFERLLAMKPVTAATLPVDAPRAGICMFSEGERHMYVGRTSNLRQRMRNHSLPASQHNQAVFAFRLAREVTARLRYALSSSVLLE